MNSAAPALFGAETLSVYTVNYPLQSRFCNNFQVALNNHTLPNRSL